MPDRVRVVFATLAVSVALGATLALAGCGSAAGPPPGPEITLRLTAPQDQSRVSTGSAMVAGLVRPAGARVEVLGRAVRVTRSGSFSMRVGLSVGTNLIDIEASAPRSTGAVAAIRVIRYSLVTVPSFSGENPAEATASLRALGLRVTIHGSSDPLGFLIPGATHICSSAPVTGTRVNPGSVITLKTSKLCF